jgi:hypothetical protein
MSTYEQRDMSGSLFKNDKREKDTHPNAKGRAMIDGVLYEVAAWTKQGKKGPFQSLSFKRVEQDQSHQGAGQSFGAPQSQGNRLSAQLDDDIPFNMEWR